MVGIRVIWEVAPAIGQLEAMAGRLRDLSPAWDSVVTYLEEVTVEQFASQGQRGGQVWKPLSETYAKWKAVKYPGQPIMKATERLFNSVTKKTSDTVLEPKPASLTWGTSVFYGRFHQRPKPGSRLPQRKFLMINDADRRAIQLIVQAHLENFARASGFKRV